MKVEPEFGTNDHHIGMKYFFHTYKDTYPAVKDYF